MAKPISLFYYPDEMFNGVTDKKVSAVDVMQMMNKAMPDYYWLCFPNHNLKFPKLQVFFEKDMTEIEYDDLVDLIRKKVDKLVGGQ